MIFDDMYVHGVESACAESRAVVWLDVPRWDLPMGWAAAYRFFAWHVLRYIPYISNIIQRTNNCFETPEAAVKCNTQLLV